MKSTSTIQLSKDAIRSNIRFIKKLMGDNVMIASVVKSNAYGHGTELIVPEIEKNGINTFAVFSAMEAQRVHNSVVNSSTSIIIMGYVADDDVDWVIENGIECYVSDSIRCKKLLASSKKLNKKAYIHIDLETGMNRTGLNFEDLQKTISILQGNPDHFHIKGICTHFAGSESISNYVRIQNQFKKFNSLVEYLLNKGIKSDLLHAACSAGSVTYPETRLDMVRIGILQYGFWPSKETFIQYIHDKKNKRDPLKRVLRWSSTVMDIKAVTQGEFIGYGNYYQASKNMVIAIIPVGYHNGYSRSLSNQGIVLINNQRIAVIGMVNMNMIVCDVSKLKNIKLAMRL